MKKILLSLSFITAALVGKAQNCSELFISEYVEGSGNNKAIEIYNPTANPINLSNYRLVRYSNGSALGTDSTDFTTTASIASYSTFVIANGQTTGTPSSPACSPTLQALANQLDGVYPAPTYVNGDDAMVLVRKSPYARIDIFGKIGEQPTTAWSDVAPYDGTVGKWWTKDHSLQRKATVKQGVTANPLQFNVTLEWDSLPRDNWSKLGSHTCDCQVVGVKENTKSVSVKVFPNPSNGKEIALVSDKVIKEVVVINAVGQTVYSQMSSEKTVVIKPAHLVEGIYYCIIKTETGSKTEKLIIQ